MKNRNIFLLTLTACLLMACGETPASSSASSKGEESSTQVSSEPAPSSQASTPQESSKQEESSVVVSSEEEKSSQAEESTVEPEESSQPVAESSLEPEESSESVEESSFEPEESSEPVEESSLESEESSEPEPSSVASSSKERETFDGIKVYCEPSWTHVYAWNDKTQYCGDWPGTQLNTSGDWKYYEFPQIDYINLIFNKGIGGEQTKDLSLNQKGVYYYLNDKWYIDEPTGDESSSAYVPSGEYPAISDKNYVTFYQLLVYSFADGNGDGIGDFKGIIDHLDYLDDLGVKALWLSPVQSSESYHSYDCTDYYSIKSQYEVTVKGVKYDIDKLLEACHAKGIKVIMDMVLNHTSSKHVWVSQHPDWYGHDSKFGFPEFDFDKPVVREAIKDVGRYWLDKGVDGFRLDAAYWVYNSGYDRDEKNFAWWQEFSHAMKETNPDCYLVGEVLDENHDLAYDYTSCGFDSTFDFEAPKQTYQAFNGNASDFAANVAAGQKKIDARNPEAIMARALSNHDIGRFSHQHPDSSDKAFYIENEKQYKAAIALNALTPGNTFVYYGDELGLKATADGYTDQNYRTPMPFESGQTDSKVYFEDFHGTGASTWSTLSGKSIAADQADPYSAYGVLKEAIALKNGNVILQRGRVVESSIKKGNLIDYKITYNGESVRFFCNTSATSSMQVDVEGTLGETITVTSDQPTLKAGKLTLPACSIAFVMD